MHVLSVVGSRPQFIKAAVVSRAFEDAGVRETLIHTGQHYDENMSSVFFDEMGIREPAFNLEVGSGSHAFQTGEAMQRLEEICNRQVPDAMLVYGDTNATLAGALVGAKLCVPVAHVEAGLRSFDRGMPEEINRVVADHISAWLFCPTQTAVDNLRAEGVEAGVHQVGDVMYDVALHFGQRAKEHSRILETLGVAEEEYVLATIHRDFNTDNGQHLAGIADGLAGCGCPVVFPAHPRVRKQLDAFGLLQKMEQSSSVRIIDPVGYLDMVRLEMGARTIVTDSGGVQKEAFFHRVPCLTVRPSTEWVETVTMGWNRLVEPQSASICGALEDAVAPDDTGSRPYGDGHAAEQIVRILTGSAERIVPRA